MSTFLLDLSDETLQHIGYFLHIDNFIPLPSFGPHWENYASEIDPEISKDYMSFRSSCKRIHALCPIRGLHVILKTCEQLYVWTTMVPDNILQGVRRLEINIPPVKERSIAATWAALIFLLGSLSNLEDLVLAQSPICNHDSSNNDTAHLKSPRPITLPRLLSFANDDKCEHCRAVTYDRLLTHMPSLQSIKTSLHDNIFGELAKRQKGDYTASQQSVQKLYLNINDMDFWDIFGDGYMSPLPKIFPGLRSLNINCHYGGFGVLNTCAHLRASKPTSTQTAWTLEFDMWNSFDGGFALFADTPELETEYQLVRTMAKTLERLFAPENA